MRIPIPTRAGQNPSIEYSYEQVGPDQFDLYQKTPNFERKVSTLSRKAILEFIRGPKDPNYVPLGDWAHQILAPFFGSNCLSCAKRQAKMNHILPRRRT